MNDHRRALPSIGTALLGALGALGVIGILGAPSVASADVSADSGELDEIVVTASLRALPESQVPGSVSVLDAGTLRDAGQQNFADVMALVPNLNWAGDTSLPRYFQIRGIGELQQYQGAPNPSVGFLIDDIDFSGLGGVATLFDVDHIEVLRGPQGTLYGANALAGLIYVKSAEPQDRFGGRVEIDAGDYAEHSVGAVLTGPVPALDSAFRLAVQQYYSDGFYDNVYLHRKNIDDRDELSMRAKWRYQPSTDWLVDVTVLRLQIDNGYDAWSLFGNRNTESDDPSADRQYSTGLSAHATYTGFDGLTLTTIGTFADSVIDYGYDGDWGNPILWAPYTYEYTENQIRHRSTRSLELRLADTAQHGLSWLFGVYGFQLREGLTDTSAGLYVDPFDASQNTDTLTVLDSSYRSTHGALYGQLDGDLGTRSRWSLGLRGERQTTGYRDLTTNLDAASTANRFHPGYDLWGGQASLDYALTPAQRLYALLSRGYKAGGFNLSPGLAANEIAYAPENDLNIEFGDKATLAGGALRIDGDVFYMVRKSLQLLTGTQLDPDNPDAFVFYTGNAASGDNYGLEGSLAWRATRSLELGGSLGLLQTQYRGFVQSDVVLPSRELPNAPNWQAALNGTWRDPRGPYLRVDVTGMGGFYYDMPPNWTASKPYGLVNAKLGWQNDRYEVTVWGRNLLDKDYTVRGFYFGDQPPNFPNTLYRQLGDPRHWGVHATVKF
jgi:outer membrane receptor protein involved in Fe transport